MLFIDWLYGEQNQVRPTFPKNTSQADLIKASKMFDLAPQMPPVDWAKAFEHLPEKDLISNVDGPKGIFSDKMPNTTGGAMIERTPNDPAWRKGGIWQSDTMPINVPGFWFMTWYDISTGPNLAAYNFVRSTAKGEAANEQYAVIAPTLHCGYKRAKEDTIVGERSMGDARLDYDALTYAWFDHFLKGEDNGFLQKQPKVTYFTMGINKWQHSETWPPQGAKPVTLTFQAAATPTRSTATVSSPSRRSLRRRQKSPKLPTSSLTIPCTRPQATAATSAARATASPAPAVRSTSARWKSVPIFSSTPQSR